MLRHCLLEVILGSNYLALFCIALQLVLCDSSEIELIQHHNSYKYKESHSARDLVTW